MKDLKVKKIDSANATASAILPKSLIDEKLKKAAQNAAKNVSLPGFRKGHVPASEVQKRYGAQLQADAQKDAIREMIDIALKELNIAKSELIGDARVAKFEPSGDDFLVDLDISLNPKIELGELDGFIPSVKIPKVPDLAILERLEEIAKNRAPLVEISDERHKLKDGEFAKIDFEGFIDGSAFAGGSAKGHTLQIGSHSFIDGFEEQLVGMKKGEEKEIKVRFPSDYQAAHLADKEATFKVKLHEISTRGKVEIDDNFAKTLLPNDKDASVEKIKEQIKEQLTNEKKQEIYNEKYKEELINALANGIKFDIPKNVVEQEMDLILRSNFEALEPEKQKEIAGKADEIKALRESGREDAERSVKITFIIDAIGKKEKIDIPNNEVINTIYFEAMAARQDPRAMFEYYKNNNLIPAVKMAMLEERILTNLLDKKAEFDSADVAYESTSKKSDKAEKSESKAKKSSTAKETKGEEKAEGGAKSTTKRATKSAK